MLITDVTCTMLRLPNVEPIADGTQDVLVVEVATDAGLVGVGEAHTSPWIAKAVIEAPLSHYMVRGLKDLVVGEDARNIRPLWDKMYRYTQVIGRRGIVMHAISAIDIALWDLKGKAAGLPVHNLLGGSYVDRLRPYASILSLSGPEDSARRVEELVQEGFEAVKIGWSGLGQDVEDDVATVRAIRETVGDGIGIMVDVGAPMRPDRALALADRLHELGVLFLEEPLDPDDIDGYARLTAATRLPIAAGEKETGRFAFRQLIERRAVDVLQPDVARIGGITEAMRVADLAAAHGLDVVPHCWSTDILVSATCHFAACLPRTPLLEFAITGTPLRSDVAREPIVIEDGHVRVPQRPGLGIDLNHDTIDTYRFAA